MKRYELVENVDHYAHYDLLSDNETILKAGLYDEVLQLLYQMIQPGDTYQEFHESRYEFPILDYDVVMRLKQNSEEWSDGSLS